MSNVFEGLVQWDLKSTTQRPGGVNTGMTPEGDPGDGNRGAEFGTSERATRGTDRDLDRGCGSKRLCAAGERRQLQLGRRLKRDVEHGGNDARV